MADIPQNLENFVLSIFSNDLFEQSVWTERFGSQKPKFFHAIKICKDTHSSKNVFIELEAKFYNFREKKLLQLEYAYQNHMNKIPIIANVQGENLRIWLKCYNEMKLFIFNTVLSFNHIKRTVIDASALIASSTLFLMQIK